MSVRIGSRIFVAWLLIVPAGVSAQDPAAPRVNVRDVAVVTGRIDRIDPFSRSLVVRTAEGLASNVYVGPELKIFDELRAGDSVTVRITESVVVALRPNAKTTVVEDQTAAAKKGASGAAADVLQQLKATVTVENVDVATGMITYKGADNRSVMRTVSDRRLIDGLKRGDIIEITYTRARAIELTKNP
jgi:Cu/Ag efflux protein CusF